MCWYCCISLRGAVYFGASVHIFVGLVLLVRWVVLTYLDIVSERIFMETNVLVLCVMSGFYVLLFILVGCFIFAATERQSGTLLKWSTLGFLILQFTMFSVILVQYLVVGWTFLEPAIRVEEPFLTIAMYFCCIVASLNYLLVLVLYLRKLWSKSSKNRTSTSSSIGNIPISHPIPHNHNVNAARFNQLHYQNRQRATQHQGPESPGIYESLEQSQTQSTNAFYPANFYSGYNNGRGDGIYGGSIRSSGSGGGYYPSSNRSYPNPYQRYRDPLIPPTSSVLVGAPRASPNNEEEETAGQDWRNAYGHRLQVFQRGSSLTERNASATSNTEPLLMRQPQQTNY